MHSGYADRFTRGWIPTAPGWWRPSKATGRRRQPLSRQAIVEAAVRILDTEGALYRVAPDTVRIFRLPVLRVIKVSFPRPTVQGGIHDRDMHAGQQHVPLLGLPLNP